MKFSELAAFIAQLRAIFTNSDEQQVMNIVQEEISSLGVTDTDVNDQSMYILSERVKVRIRMAV